MNKSILNYTLLVILAFGCQYVHHSKSYYYESGKIKMKLTTTDGKIRCINYYENGKLQSEGEILANGDRIGSWNYYNDNGKLKATGSYYDGLKDGNWNYNIDDSSYTINWRAYTNRPIKINIPEDWILKEQLAPYVPLACFSDSTNSVANFNIVLMNKESKDIDSIITEIIKNGREKLRYSIDVLSVQEVEINEAKGKIVTQRILADNKHLIATQYFLDPGDDTIYMISFFVNEGKQAVYEALIKEIAFSFKSI